MSTTPKKPEKSFWVPTRHRTTDQEFKSEFLGEHTTEWTEERRKAREIVEAYVDQTDAYDRSIGLEGQDVAHSARGSLLGMSIRNARESWKVAEQKARDASLKNSDLIEMRRRIHYERRCRG